MKDYFCDECHKPCEGVWRDFGIGSYEYWGQVCRDKNTQYVSECCDGDLLESLPEEDK